MSGYLWRDCSAYLRDGLREVFSESRHLVRDVPLYTPSSRQEHDARDLPGMGALERPLSWGNNRCTLALYDAGSHGRLVKGGRDPVYLDLDEEQRRKLDDLGL